MAPELKEDMILLQNYDLTLNDLSMLADTADEFAQSEAIPAFVRVETGDDPNSKDVCAAGFAAGNELIFTDGFESGDTSGWSEHVPQV